MKAALVVAFAVLWAGSARAQLDHILAPAPSALEMAKLEGTAGNPVGADQGTGPAGGGAAGKSLRTLTGGDLLDELQKQLVTYFGLKGDLKLSLDRDWNPIPLPGKDLDLTITDYPPDGVTSSFGVGFKVASGGIEVGQWQVALRAQLWQSVWVTQSSLDRGQKLDRSMLTSQKIDVLRARQTLLSDDIDPAGYDVLQGIGPGLAIAKQDVIERPVIHKGDVVEVVAVQGLMDIHMKALALEDGAMNALIKMRNLDSDKGFSAQVLNENEVKVHF